MKIQIKHLKTYSVIEVRKATELETSLNQFDQGVKDWAKVAYKIMGQSSRIKVIQ